MEKQFKASNGYLQLVLWFVLAGLCAGAFVVGDMLGITLGIILAIVAFGWLFGFAVLEPGEALVLVLFGEYKGTLTDAGFFYLNPFLTKKKISLRAQNMNGQQLKVNDAEGNPIEIAAVVVWKVQDTARAMFQVEDYKNYIQIQSEAAVRHLASSLSYDVSEDHPEGITLRSGGDQVTAMLVEELNQRMEPAGIHIMEARISHLAYAPEIAGAMLQRQQAAAILAARNLIVKGAVSMVQMAIHKLEEDQIVDLDPERKAAMVSNLLVVLCGERATSPVINTGSLH